jgi:hypothetical protein
VEISENSYESDILEHSKTIVMEDEKSYRENHKSVLPIIRSTPMLSNKKVNFSVKLSQNSEILCYPRSINSNNLKLKSLLHTPEFTIENAQSGGLG